MSEIIYGVLISLASILFTLAFVSYRQNNMNKKRLDDLNRIGPVVMNPALWNIRKNGRGVILATSLDKDIRLAIWLGLISKDVKLDLFYFWNHEREKEIVEAWSKHNEQK